MILSTSAMGQSKSSSLAGSPWEDWFGKTLNQLVDEGNKVVNVQVLVHKGLRVEYVYLDGPGGFSRCVTQVELKRQPRAQHSCQRLK